MKNLAPNASAPKPRRLDFTPKPKAAPEPHDKRKAREAQLARQAKPELFLMPPFKRPRLPADADFAMHFDHARTMWSGSFECEGIYARSEATTLKFLIAVLDEKWRGKVIERDALLASGVPLEEASKRVSSSRPKLEVIA